MTRALWASLGAGTSLVLMGVGVLAAVSTIVGFNGWPGASRGAGATPSAMLAQSAPAPLVEGITTPARIVVPDAPSRERRGSGGDSGLVDAAGGSVPAGAVPGATSDTGAGTGATPGRSVQGTSITPRPPVAPESVTEPVRKAGSELGNSTGQTVGDLGKAVAPVSPALGDAVGDVGGAVGDTVRVVTDTLSDALDSALTKPSP